MLNYRFETFRPGVETDPETGKKKVDARTAAFFEAVNAGFHDKREDDEKMLQRYERSHADGRIFTGVYAPETQKHALSTDVPVATFVHFEAPINVGENRLQNAHMITWVTVRPTHRRRGLLRTMMTNNLKNAAAAGFPFAALTATEGGIYRRYGFGTASWMGSFEVDTNPGFRLAAEADSRVEMCEAAVLKDLAPSIYERFMRTTPGAGGRQQRWWDLAAGKYDFESGGPDPAARAALHYDEDGEPDGYVTYKFTGWDKPTPTVQVLDLIAVSDAAYSSLWSFLGSIDLVERVKYDGAQPSPLPWLLENPRRVQQKSHWDLLWLRILDVKKALEARQWLVPGSLTLKVTDSLGYAEGTWRIDSDGADATVEQVPDAQPDLELDVAELGSIYLGGADPSLLTRAGRITERTPGAAVRARLMFSRARAPYTPYEF